MRWIRVTVYIISTLFSIALITIVAVINTDLGYFKDRIVPIVSQSLNRSFNIDGELYLTIGRTIELKATEVQLAAMPWSIKKDLSTLKSIEISIDTLSLYHGPIKINSLVVDGLDVNLEERDSDNNWTFFEETEDEKNIDAVSNQRPSLPVILIDAKISNTVIRHFIPDHAQPNKLNLQNLSVELDTKNHVYMQLNGDINGTEIKLNANASDVNDLVKYLDVEFSFIGKLGKISFNGNAHVKDLLNPKKPIINFNVSGANVEYLTDLLHYDRITTGPLDLSLKLSPHGEKMELNLEGDVGEFKISASGNFDDLQEFEKTDLRFSASGPDIGTLLSLLGKKNTPHDPYNISGVIHRSGTIVTIENFDINISKTKISLNGEFVDFPNPQGANAKLKIQGVDLRHFAALFGFNNKVNGSFELEADLTPIEDKKTVITLNATGAGIKIKLSSNISNRTDFIGTHADFEISGKNLQKFTDIFDYSDVPAEKFNASAIVNLTSKGYVVNNGNIRVGADLVTLQGLISRAPLAEDSDIQLSIITPDFKSSLSSFGINVKKMPAGELRLKGQIKSQNNQIIFRDMTATLAGTRVDLHGKLGKIPSLEGTDLNINARNINLSEYLPQQKGFNALNKPLNLMSNLLVYNNTLTFSKTQLQLDKTILLTDISIGLTPGLNYAGDNIQIKINSLDIAHLIPKVSDIIKANKIPLNLQASGAWKNNLLTLEKINVALGENTLKSSGKIKITSSADNTNIEKADLSLDVKIASIQDFNILTELNLPDEPVQVKFQLNGNQNEFSINKMNTTIGKSDLKGSLHVRLDKTPFFHIDLVSNRLNAKPFLLALNETSSDLSQNSPAKTSTSNEKLIPDTPISIAILQDFDAKVNLRVNQLNLLHRSLSNIAVNGSVSKGTLAINKFSLSGEKKGSLNAQLSLTPVATGTKFHLTADGKELKIGLPALTKKDNQALPSYDIDLAINTTGNTLHEMVGTMDGYVRVVSGSGKIRNGVLNVFAQDFLFELLNTINPFAKNDPYSNLKCGVLLAAVKQGTLTGDPVLVLQTKKLNVFADITVDLKSEKFIANFNTIPMKGLGIGVSDFVNPFINVGGTLANPVIIMDTQSALLQGGAAFFTAGLSIIAKSFKNRFFSDEDQCGKAIDEAEKEFRALQKNYTIDLSSAAHQ